MDDKNKISIYEKIWEKMVAIKLTFFLYDINVRIFYGWESYEKMMGFLDFWVVLMSFMKINYCLYCLK